MFSKLSSDVVTIIIGLLPLNDKFQVRCINKEWEQLAIKVLRNQAILRLVCQHVTNRDRNTISVDFKDYESLLKLITFFDKLKVLNIENTSQCLNYCIASVNHYFDRNSNSSIFDSDEEDSGPFLQGLITKCAPNLEDIRLDSYIEGILELDTEIVLPNLKSLKARGCHVDTLRCILQTSPLLEQLDLQHSLFNSGKQEHDEDYYEYHSCSSSSLSDDDFHHYEFVNNSLVTKEATVFPVFDLPNLRSLHLKITKIKYFNEMFDTFKTMKNLKELHLDVDTGPFAKAEFERVLSLVPGLDSLKIEGLTFGLNAAQKFFSLVPDLSCLWIHLVTDYGDEASDDCLSKTILSHLLFLRSIRIQGLHNFPLKTVMEFIRNAGSQGITDLTLIVSKEMKKKITKYPALNLDFANRTVKKLKNNKAFWVVSYCG